MLRRHVNPGPRTKARELYKKGIYQAREARVAELCVSALALEIRRSNNHSPGVPPQSEGERRHRRRATMSARPRGSGGRGVLQSIEDRLSLRATSTRELSVSTMPSRSFCRSQSGSSLFERHHARPSGPCTTLTPRQLAILRLHTTRLMSRVPTNEEATLTLAEFGGHLRSNGPPGWVVLGRALDRLLLIEIGWNHRANAIDD